MDEELVGIQLRQLGVAGQLGVDVHLATADIDPVRPRPVGDVRLQLVTSCGQLELFARSVVSMMAGDGDEVVLLGEHFSQAR